MSEQELEGYYVITVQGRNGYSFGLHCEGIDEYEAVERALEYYDDPKDIDYAVGEKMTERDWTYYKNNIVELDNVK